MFDFQKVLQKIFSFFSCFLSFSVSIYIQTLNTILPLNGGTLTPWRILSTHDSISAGFLRQLPTFGNELARQLRELGLEMGTLLPYVGDHWLSSVTKQDSHQNTVSCWVTSVVSDSVRPHRWQPARLPHPWDSPGENTGVGCYFLLQCRKVKSESEVAQLCPTFSDPMDCSLPGSSVHGIFQARVLEWVAIAFSEFLIRTTLLLVFH